MSRLAALILALVAAAYVFTACGGSTSSAKTSTSGVLNNVALIGDDHNFSLIDQSCWDWYPEGDGVFWALSSAVGGQAIRFPFTSVSKGTAIIQELGKIKKGDVIYVRYSNGIQPIFKIIDIDPAKGGVLVAPTGNVTGDCKPPTPRIGA